MGVLRFWRGVLRAILGRRRRRGWAVLPRNSAVFRLSEGSARRFSARRTQPGWLGKKIFKKGAENLKIGMWEVPEGANLGTLYRACGVIFRRDF